MATNSFSFLRHSYLWRWILAFAAATTTIISVGVVYQALSLKWSHQSFSESKAAIPSSIKVAALGRLEPVSEIICLNVPLPLDGDRVEKLFVKEGSTVSVGQVVAILDSRKRLESAVKTAEEQLKVQKARLSQVEAGAKLGEINAQKAMVELLKANLEGQEREQKANIAKLQAQLQGETAAQEAVIDRLKAEIENADTECKRYQILYQKGFVSISDYERKCLQQKTLQESLKEAEANRNRIITTYQQQITEAKANLRRTQATGIRQIEQAEATLNHISEIRPVDIQLAQAEVDNALANLQQAKTNLNQVYIKSPIDGQILKIHTRVGEKIDDSGLVELAQTYEMMAIAEVYQTDIEQVQIGQKAVITSQAFSGQLNGTVSELGLKVSQQNVFSNQPGENLDRRVVEVKIRLNPQDSKRVANLTNLQVEIQIQIDKPNS